MKAFAVISEPFQSEQISVTLGSNPMVCSLHTDWREIPVDLLGMGPHIFQSLRFVYTIDISIEIELLS